MHLLITCDVPPTVGAPVTAKISITLPSIYPEALNRTLANIRATTRNEYEVIVVSPFRVEEQNVIWIEETERRGCNFAQDIAARYATGDFITAFADDWIYVDGWDEKILPDFLEREHQWEGKYLMGLRYDHWDLVGTVFGIYYANFPFMRRSNLDRYGWLAPEYKLGFGDCDLSLRVWHHDGRCEFSREKVLTITEEDGLRKKNIALFTPEDFALFVSRWGPIYGRGLKTDELRDFNLDVVPEILDEFAAERTIYRNDPEFLRILVEKAKVSQTAPRLVERLNATNIIAFQGLFFCVPQALGTVDLPISEHRQRKGIQSYASLPEARAAAARQTVWSRIRSSAPKG